ncbi:MAG: GNAT family N-acetyltransferase, partial [Betaproteobacteria bacterium]
MTPPFDAHLLDDIVWRALSGAHARFAAGTAHARRYARGFSPIVGFANRLQPDFDGFDDFCERGEHFYCDGWSGPAPTGWTIDVETTMVKMIWASPDDIADDLPDAIRLSARDVAQAIELTALTQPGPFGSRTIELGEYFG